MNIPRVATLEQLRSHLKLPVPLGSPADDLEGPDLQIKLDAATQLICEYIADRHPADPAWIAEIEAWGVGSPSEAAPPVIVLAVLEQAAELYRFRGDDVKADRPQEDGCLAYGIENLLSRYKNRAFA